MLLWFSWETFTASLINALGLLHEPTLPVSSRLLDLDTVECSRKSGFCFFLCNHLYYLYFINLDHSGCPNPFALITKNIKLGVKLEPERSYIMHLPSTVSNCINRPMIILLCRFCQPISRFDYLNVHIISLIL